MTLPFYIVPDLTALKALDMSGEDDSRYIWVQDQNHARFLWLPGASTAVEEPWIVEPDAGNGSGRWQPIDPIKVSAAPTAEVIQGAIAWLEEAGAITETYINAGGGSTWTLQSSSGGGGEPAELRTGLVFWHDMSEPEGIDFADQTGAAADYTYVNDNAVDVVTDPTIGVMSSWRGTTDTWSTYDTGLYFNGFNNTFQGLLGANDWTYNVWVVLDDPPTSDPGGQSGSYPFPEYEIVRAGTERASTLENSFRVRYVIANDEIELEVWNDTRASTVVVAAISRNTPSLISVYHDGTNGEIGLSINGAAYVTGAHSGGVDDRTGDFGFVTLTLGPDSYDFVGGLSRDSFYSRLLAAADLAALYNGGASIDYAGTA